MGSFSKSCIAAAAAILLSSCSILTKSQVEMTAALSIASDTLTRCPSSVFNLLSDVHSGRSYFYAASLTSPDAHFMEIQSLANHAYNDSKEALKADCYLNILNSYCRALKGLASTQRYESYGTELRSIGRKTDSLIIAMESAGLIKKEIASGYAKISGRYAAFITEGIVRSRQTKAVREFVSESDTLITQCVDELISVLKSEQLTAIFNNEKAGLDDDFRAFLHTAYQQNLPSVFLNDYDKEYVILKHKLEDAEKIKSGCASALRTFARAHSRLTAALGEKRTKYHTEMAESVFDDIIELNNISAALATLIKKGK